MNLSIDDTIFNILVEFIVFTAYEISLLYIWIIRIIFNIL